MHLYKKLIVLAVLTIGFLGFTTIIASTSNIALAADAKDAVCEGVNLGTGGTCGDDGTVNDVIAKVINILSWIVGLIAVIMVIIGGFQFVTSTGDPQKASKARMTITYAIVGLIVAALAQVIIRFVLKTYRNYHLPKT